MHHIVGQHLLPEIRTTINYVVEIFPGEQYRYPEPFIPGVSTPADGVVAPDDRDTLRSACAQKSDLQPLVRLNQIYNLFI